MAETPNLGLPLIDSNMTADVPRDVNALANAVDAAVGDMSSVPTDAKDAAGAISELYSSFSGGTNQTVRQQVELILNMDTRKTVFEYTGTVLTAIVEKDGSVEVSRTTLIYSGSALDSIIEVAGDKTVTCTINRDVNGKITDITKEVA